MSGEATDEELRKEYNAAVANGLIMKARSLDRRIKARLRAAAVVGGEQHG